MLVNGRRYVSGVAGSAAVDFNTIPTELIERVEIITGGASAIYGSDALAGVINVILKDDFEGVKFGYQYGEADAGGEIENRFNFTAGGDFAEGRGNAVMSATYTEQKGLLSRQRPNTAVDDIAECAATGEPGTCQNALDPAFSSFSEYGRFFVPSTGEYLTVSEGTGATGTVVPWDSAQFGFNRQHFRRYTVPTDRYLVSSLFDYDMGGGVNAFVEATFAQTRTDSELEPFAHSNSDLKSPAYRSTIRSCRRQSGTPCSPRRRRGRVLPPHDRSRPARRARRRATPTASWSASKATWRKSTTGRPTTPSAAWMTPSGAAARSTCLACARR